MSDDDTYEVPLQDQRVFGAGIKRKRIKFVPSTEAAASHPPPPSQSSAQTVSNFYMNLVLPGDKTSSTKVFGDESLEDLNCELQEGPTISQVCAICKLPFTSESTELPNTDEPSLSSNSTTLRYRPHEASLAHQVCLAHSHPPSHLDRNRKGLAYLSSYGWDPDARTGLGASGQGIQFPIKTKPKDDKMGIGVVLPKEAERRKKEKPKKLDAGKVRKLHEKDRRKAERLREMFYRNDDVERYLGGS